MTDTNKHKWRNDWHTKEWFCTNCRHWMRDPDLPKQCPEKESK